MESEKLSKTKVSITKGGLYPILPWEMKYKKKGDYETLEVGFQVQLGYKISCFVNKTIFFNGDTQKVNKEVNYLLKFICPECLKNQYNAKTFKEYVEKLSEDVNKHIKSQFENKSTKLLFGKLIKKSNSNFVEFAELFSKNGYEQQYLAYADSMDKALYFTEWEIENLDLPFTIIEKAIKVSNDAPELESAASSSPGTNWGAADKDELPF